jgi:hypothetical protein
VNAFRLWYKITELFEFQDAKESQPNNAGSHHTATPRHKQCKEHRPCAAKDTESIDSKLNDGKNINWLQMKTIGSINILITQNLELESYPKNIQKPRQAVFRFFVVRTVEKCNRLPHCKENPIYVPTPRK